MNHHIFADDLIIFYKGYDASVKRVGEALLHFSQATGLRANSEKSSIYLAGVKDDMRQRLLELTGLELGKFLMRYLDLPLSPRK
ncbi:hypothetical protein H5410_047003 [Solanum commersonii]|uniref:Reverse transcriptase domain-containing protein n=1 Tax=Solanum commersonii TaxID=4109 RepID=A0A9J5XDT7_SOLCO|nr:hypothetical protein H5410_047003 [Solanum commersonii]